MLLPRRRLIALVGAASVLAACSGGGEAGPRGEYELPSDMALGDPNAPVTLIEYASTTCGHCRDFHETVYPALKANYIDTGKLRFVFREYPTAPREIAAAGFQIARCAGETPEEYFNLIGVLFAQQDAIFEAAQRGEARAPLLAIARSANLSEAQFDQCVSDAAGLKRFQEIEKAAEKFDITGTPTLILNGEKLPMPYTYETLAKLIDAKSS